MITVSTAWVVVHTFTHIHASMNTRRGSCGVSETHDHLVALTVQYLQLCRY